MRYLPNFFRRGRTAALLGFTASVCHGLSGEAAHLSLQDAVAIALQSNFGLQIAAVDPQIASQSVIRAEAGFDFELFANGTVRQSEQATTFSQTSGTSSDNRTLSVGARKAFDTGTSLTAQTNLDRRFSNAGVNTSNLSQEADIALSLRQPLLQGFGRTANRAVIEQARAALSRSSAELRDAVLGTLAAIESAYWQAARRQETLALRESSVEAAQALLAEARERLRVGVATELDVLQAEAANAQRTEALIAARADFANAVDALFEAMGTLNAMPMDDALPVVDTLPAFEITQTPMASLWSSVQSAHPTLRAQEAAIQAAAAAVVSARDARRPELDLVLTGAYIGLDDTAADTAYERAFEREGHAWSVGIEFSMPLGNRSAIAAERSAELQREQAELRLLEIKQSLFRSLRAAWRSANSAQQSLDAAGVSVRLQEAAFTQEKERYDNGLSVFRDVLEAQQALDEARIRALNAKATLAEARIALDRLTGELFSRYTLSDFPNESGNP